MPAPVIEVSIKVNGTEKAGETVAARYVKTVLQDLGKWDGTTPQEKADALLGFITDRCILDPAVHRKANGRHAIIMQQALDAAGDPWTADRVGIEGLAALEAAYDLLP